MQTLGDYLKEVREQKGIRLEEIASITKIHLQSLRHIEESRWDKLPPEPFIRGFITAYAKYVGVEPSEAIERYAHETLSSVNETPQPEPPPSASLDEAPKVESAGFQFNPKYALAGVVVLLFVGIIAFVLNTGKKSAQAPVETAKTEDSDLSQEELAALLGEESGTTEAKKVDRETPDKADRPVAAVKKAAPAADKQEEKQASVTSESDGSPVAHAVQIQSGERSWIKVVVDDKEPVEYFLGAGKKVFYTASEKIKVVVGNAEGAEILYNGEKTAGIKYRSGVSAFIFPKGAKFPQDVPPARPTASESEKADETAPEENSNNDTGLDLDLE